MARENRNNFAALRLIAALMVLRGHMQYLIGSFPDSLLGEGIQEVGVQIFFLIGGYLITNSWCNDPHPIRYGLKRFFRIFPPLFFCVMFSALVIGPLCTNLSMKEYFTSPALGAYFHNLRLFIVYNLPGVFAGNPYPVAVNGSLWTLPIEVAMYLIVAVLLFLFSLMGKGEVRRRQGIGMAVTAILALLLRMYLFYPIWGWTDMVRYGTSLQSAIPLIPYYLLGSVYTLIVPKERLNLPLALCTFLVTSAILSGNPLFDVVRLLVLSYLVFSLAFAAPVLPLPGWMEISYGIYLFGFPIQQTVVYFAQKWGWSLNNPNRLLAVSLLFILPLALVSEYLVERPAGKLCKKICSFLENQGK